VLGQQWPFTAPAAYSSRKHNDANEQKQMKHLLQVDWKLPRQYYKLLA